MITVIAYVGLSLAVTASHDCSRTTIVCLTGRPHAHWSTPFRPNAGLDAIRTSGRRRGCLAYRPDTVAIAGRLTRHTFFGAPGFGEDPAHDTKETGYYLDLPSPVCTKAGPMDEPVRSARRVQLVLDSTGYARLRPLLGRNVTLRGTLFAAFTGHHHAPLLLDVVRSPSERERERGRQP